MELSVVMVGLSAIESIPIYHFMPGSRALRVLLKPYTSIDCKLGESRELEVCEWGRGPEVYPGVLVDVAWVKSIAGRWTHDVVFLDGVEPLAEASSVLRERVFDKPLCSRSQGLARVELPPWLDCILLEDLSLIAPQAVGNIADLLEASRNLGAHVEVAVYAEKAGDVESSESVELAARYKTPLHVFVAESHWGGLRELYEKLRKANPYTYIHSGGFYEHDTYCENCGAILAQRSRSTLVTIVEDPSCPRCGNPLPFREPRSRSWKRGVLRSTRGKPFWVSVLALKIASGEALSERGFESVPVDGSTENI
ncbi:MAG: hypothetical protein QXS85_05295 [Acidilobaceae archaeon]